MNCSGSFFEEQGLGLGLTGNTRTRKPMRQASQLVRCSGCASREILKIAEGLLGFQDQCCWLEIPGRRDPGPVGAGCSNSLNNLKIPRKGGGGWAGLWSSGGPGPARRGFTKCFGYSTYIHHLIRAGDSTASMI